jgi:hypothetical protein
MLKGCEAGAAAASYNIVAKVGSWRLWEKISLALSYHLKRGAALASASLLVYVTYRCNRGRISKLMRRAAARYLQTKGIEPGLEVDVVRASFKATDFTSSTSPDPNHTHGQAAAERRSANAALESYALSMGARPYHVQMSKSQSGHALTGSRLPYWGRDLGIHFQNDSRKQGDVYLYTDVEQYLDINEEFARHPAVHAFYTFVPGAAAGCRPGYAFHATEGGLWKYFVSGGGEFVGKVWDHSSDWVMVYQRRLGIPIRSVLYMIDRAQVGKDHQVLNYAPAKVYTGLAALVAYFTVGEKKVKRLRGREDGFTALLLHSEDGLNISVAEADNTVAATLPYSTYASLLAAAAYTKATAYSIRSYVTPAVEELHGVDEKDARLIVSKLMARYLNVHSKQVLPVVNLAPLPNQELRMPASYDDDESKPLVTPFMPAFILGESVTHLSSPEVEEDCVAERIMGPQRTVRRLPVTDVLTGMITDFVSAVIPVGGIGHPLDEDEVRERMTRRAQIMGVDEASEIGAERGGTSMFLKREASGVDKAGRAITTNPTILKLDWSAYCVALSDFVKNESVIRDCYGFRKPMDVAQRVAEVCQSSNGVWCNDWSKYDAHVSGVIRLFERALTFAAFPDHTADLRRIFLRKAGLRARGTFGTRYYAGDARNSGDSETSIFNTLANIFSQYVAKRCERRQDGGFYSHSEAMEWLLLHVLAAGDDSLVGDIEKASMDKMVRMVGGKLTYDFIPKGERGVNFLARYYSPDVHYGDPASMCDVRRTLKNFNLSVPLPQGVLPWHKARQRAVGLSLTDGNTPLVGVLSAKILEVTTEDSVRAAQCHTLQSYWSRQAGPDGQFPNEYGEWMDAEIEVMLADYDTTGFCAWVHAAADIDAILSPPAFMEAPVYDELKPRTEISLVDGDIIIPGPEHVPDLTPLEEPIMAPEEAVDLATDLAREVGARDGHRAKPTGSGARGTSRRQSGDSRPKRPVRAKPPPSEGSAKEVSEPNSRQRRKARRAELGGAPES